MLTTMMGSFLNDLSNSEIAILISENDFIFPAIESIHVLAITLFFGSISIVDLRLMNIGFLEKSVDRFAKAVLPWTWKIFVVAVITGLLLFISKANTYSHNFFFLLKMALLVLAGINMLVFQFITGRDIAHWEAERVTPFTARLAGFLSLCLWVSVIICGRWIGFTLNPTLGG